MFVGNRQGVSVWLTSLKFARQLRRFGHVHYVSKKMKYVIFIAIRIRLRKQSKS